LSVDAEPVFIMGYACPVCSIPQRDGEHLAHHLAFTAMIHADDHEAWLDEHAPGWGGRTPEALAEAVVDHAEPAEYHEVFEDTVDRGRPAVDAGTEHADHDHDDPRAHRGRRGAGVDAPDPETAAVLEEARELTRQMRANDANDVEKTPDTDDCGDTTDAADDER
jgi:hypothetical protein